MVDKLSFLALKPWPWHCFFISPWFWPRTF